MLRLAVLDVVLFLLPFAAYGLYVWASRAGSATRSGSATRVGSAALSAGGPVLRLVAAGLALAVAGLILFGVFGSEHSRGRYVPAQYRDGKLIPDHFE